MASHVAQNVPLPPVDGEGHYGGQQLTEFCVLRDDSNGAGGSSVLSDPNLDAGPGVAMIAGSDGDDDDRY